MRALAAALVLGGCAFGDGDWFATVSPSLDARLEVPAGRDAGGGWQALDNDYQVRFERVELAVSDVELVDRGAAGLAFDPAHPPPGYSLCHNGHCHADDGRLVSYDEIAAELGGGAAAAVVAVLPVEADLDLVAGERRELGCEPGCGLPRVHLGLARLRASRLVLAGQVRDGRAEARLAGERAFIADLALAVDGEALALEAALDVPADRAHPPMVTLALGLGLSGRLVDGLDWAALAEAAEPTISLDGEAAAAVIANLAESELAAIVTRTE